MRWLNDITDVMNMILSKLWDMEKDRVAYHATICGVAESDTIEQLNSNNSSLEERVQNHVTYNGFEQRYIKMILRSSSYKADMYDLNNINKYFMHTLEL